MGSGIVKNLLNSGHTVTVWNRTVEKVGTLLSSSSSSPSSSSLSSFSSSHSPSSPQVRDFVEAGAKEALTPSDVIAEADITFSCVSDPQVHHVLVLLSYILPM